MSQHQTIETPQVADDLLMSQPDIKALTGGYSQGAAQIAELHRQGFWRARRSRVTGAQPDRAPAF